MITFSRDLVDEPYRVKRIKKNLIGTQRNYKGLSQNSKSATVLSSYFVF